MRSLALACLLAACGGSSAPEQPAKTKKEPAMPLPEPKMPGFELSRRDLKELVLAVNAHIIVLKSQTSFGEYRDVLKTVTDRSEVSVAAPFIFTEVLAIGKQGETVPMAVKSIDPRSNVQRLEKYVVRGSLHNVTAAMATPMIALGDDMAKKLGVGMGDTVRIALPLDPWRVGDGGSVPPSAAFVVGAMFHMSFDEYDTRLAFTSVAAMQQLLGYGDQVMGVEALVKDLTTSEDVARAIERALGGPPYAVQDWFELNRELFKTRD